MVTGVLENRESGIDVVGRVPWGTHFFHLYRDKEELLEVVVPYVSAGLQNGEYCMWITSDLLSPEEALAELEQSVPDFDMCLERGQIEIIPHTEWYLEGGEFDSLRVIAGWMDRSSSAIREGYEGLRLTGDVSWADEEIIGEFLKYEQQIGDAMEGQSILALCTYPRGVVTADQVVDLFKTHMFCLRATGRELELIDDQELIEAYKTLIDEYQFRLEVESRTSTCFVVFDLQGNLIDWNETVCRTSGHTGSELRNMRIGFFEEKDSEEISRAFGETVKGKSGDIISLDVGIRTKYGTTIPFGLHGTLMEDKEGKLLFICGIGRDITHRKQLEPGNEELLHERGERVKELDCLYGLARLAEIPDITLSELLQGISELIPLGWQYPEVTCARVVLGDREFKTVGFKDTDWSMSADIKLHGVNEGSIEVFYLEEMPEEDEGPFLKEERSLLDALAERAGRMVERYEADEARQRVDFEIDAYAHTVSHDLKGPTSAASLAFDMLTVALENGRVPQEEAEQLREIIEGGQSSMRNAFDIIENLLNIAEAGEPQDVSPVSIDDAVDRVLAENAQVIGEKGITVNIVSPLGEVVASPTQIYQLFSNLIRNSIEHNKAEDPVIEVSSLGVDGTVHRFLVRDNGQGIPEEILDDVFTHFVKAQSGGSGIGLSIVERVVKAYGGEIRAYNDSGACFEFTLKDYDEAGP